MLDSSVINPRLNNRCLSSSTPVPWSLSRDTTELSSLTSCIQFIRPISPYSSPFLARLPEFSNLLFDPILLHLPWLKFGRSALELSDPVVALIILQDSIKAQGKAARLGPIPLWRGDKVCAVESKVFETLVQQCF